MAKKKPIAERTVEELEKELKSLKMLTGISIGILIPLTFLGIKQSLADSTIDPSLIIALCTLSIVFFNRENRKKILAELDKRKA